MTLRWTVTLALILFAGAATAGINPANPGLPPVTTVFGGSYDNNNYSAVCVACHTRNPGARTLDTAGLGSHFIYGGSGLLTGNTGIEKLSAWTGTGGATIWSGGFSRYGKTGDNVNLVGTAGEMICESCHNLLRNTGVNKLLAADNEATDPSVLCEGCHARTGPGHHILTGETWPPGTRFPGKTLSTADSDFVRNPGPLAGSEITYPPSADAINCRSCHKAHDAQTQAGARILKRGYRTTDNAAVQGDGVNGMERTTENSITPGTPIVKDFEPLCNACHKASY